MAVQNRMARIIRARSRSMIVLRCIIESVSGCKSTYINTYRFSSDGNFRQRKKKFCQRKKRKMDKKEGMP